MLCSNPSGGRDPFNMFTGTSCASSSDFKLSLNFSSGHLIK